MIDWIVILLICFGIGFLIGKVFTRFHWLIVVPCLLIYISIFSKLSNPREIYLNFAIILGYAIGYKLLPKAINLFHEIKITIQLYISKIQNKTSFAKEYLTNSTFNPGNTKRKSKTDQETRQNRQYYKKNKHHFKQNQSKAEELNRKEQELQKQAEELKRQKLQAEEELKRARQQQAQQQTPPKTPEIKHPSNLREAFEVLDTQPGLSLSDYKKIWRDEALKYHPDKTQTLGGRLQKQAEEEMKAINRAWEIIKKNL